MTRDDTIADLVGKLDGAIKYTPILEEFAREAMAAIPLKEAASLSADELQQRVEEAVAARSDDALAIAQTGDAKFIEQLRAEIANDPDGRGYAGMTDEEVAAEMSREKDVTENIGPSAKQTVVQGVMSTILQSFSGLVVMRDGRVLDAAGLQGVIDKALEDAGNPNDDPTPVVTSVKAPPYWRVGANVPFGRNVVRAQEVARAR